MTKVMKVETPSELAVIPFGKIAVDFNFNGRYGAEKAHSADAINSLCESIQGSGLLNPLTVSPTVDGRYTLVAGFGRFQAIQKIRSKDATLFASIPCRILPVLTEEELHKANFVENNARSALREIDRYQIAKKFKERFNKTNEDIGVIMGIDHSRVSQLLAYDKLIPAFKERLAQHSNPLSSAAAVELSRLTPEQQAQVLAEFEKNPEFKTSDIKAFRQSLKEQSTPVSSEGGSPVVAQLRFPHGLKEFKELATSVVDNGQEHPYKRFVLQVLLSWFDGTLSDFDNVLQALDVESYSKHTNASGV
jgi:ParB/RepB/Spo0J family partition protein